MNHRGQQGQFGPNAGHMGKPQYHYGGNVGSGPMPPTAVEPAVDGGQAMDGTQSSPINQGEQGRKHHWRGRHEVRPENRGCWKRRNQPPTEQNPTSNTNPEVQTNTDNILPETPVVPEEPETPPQTETEPSAPRTLQQMDMPSYPGTTPSQPPQDLPMPGPIQKGPTPTPMPYPMPTPMPMPYPVPTEPGQTAPGFPGMRHGRHFRGRHFFKRFWRSNNFRRHPRGRKIFKFVLFFFIIPVIMLLCMRCARKRIAKRVRQLLEVENRLFREKYGCEWSINHKITKLSLKRIGYQTPQPCLGYPTQPVYPQPSERTPFCHPTQTAPLFTEQGPANEQIHHHGHKGYQRVSLDDSSICYQ